MAVRIEGKEGIAFYEPSLCENEMHSPTCVVAVMIGDDYEWHVDQSDIKQLDDDAYCGGCGQIGCGHG